VRQQAFKLQTPGYQHNPNKYTSVPELNAPWITPKRNQSFSKPSMMSSTASLNAMVPEDREGDVDLLGVVDSILIFYSQLEIRLTFAVCAAWSLFGLLIWFVKTDPAVHNDGLFIFLIVVAASLGIGSTIGLGVTYVRDPPAVGRFVVNLSRALAKYLSIPHQWAMRYRSNRQGAMCKSDCITGAEPLCARCREIVDASPLLSGGLWPFVSSRESHSHSSWEQLQVSAGICRLCQHLLGSVKQPPSPQQTLHLPQFDFESQTPSVGFRGYESNATPPTGGEILKIRITKTKSRNGAVKLHLQLQGKTISEPEVLRVKQGKKILLLHSSRE
jgi:hypothetical protein